MEGRRTDSDPSVKNGIVEGGTGFKSSLEGGTMERWDEGLGGGSS